jgi:hypothetical protein
VMFVNSEEEAVFKRLRRMNIIAGILHTITGVAMLALGFLLEWERPIYTFYLKYEVIRDGGELIFKIYPNPQVVFTLKYLGVLVALFPLMSAAAHFIIAGPKFDKYVENLKKGMNPYRWYEYTFSSSVMIVLIAIFIGVLDIWSLVMIFALNAVTMLLGYLMELINQYTEKTNWSPFLIGWISGIVPWIVLFAYFFAAISTAETKPPTFVYLIFFIYFILFNIFPLNMYLQYKRVGKWKGYLYGEKVYIILSLVAKTLLAWIVFAGVFSP